MYKSYASSNASGNMSGPQRSTASMQSTPAPRDDESEDDDIDWGDSKAGADGDWQMGQETSAEVYDQTAHRSAARTGDKDQRCKCSREAWLTL